MVIDIIFIVVLVLGFLQGFRKGVLQTLFYVLSIFVGILVVVKLAPGIRSFIIRQFGSNIGISYLVGIVIGFLMVLFLVRYLSKVLEKFLTNIKLNFINKIVGGAALGFFGVLIYSAFIWVLDNVNAFPITIEEQSQSYSFLRAMPDFVLSKVKQLSPGFKTFLESIFEAVRI